jgi:molecular chaperone HtpG
MDDAEQLLPSWLRFVRGVVDASDLPLNVSREILQQSRDIEAIRGGCTRKVMDLLAQIAADDKEKYAKFWAGFGRVLKEGVGEDSANRERIAGLLRFASTHTGTADESVSLADYAGRMKGGQARIYYITADTFNAARNSPQLEIFRSKGVEVLLLSDRVDEWVVGHLTEFGGKPLASVARGGLHLDSLDDAGGPAEAPRDGAQYTLLVDRIRQSLGERVKDVRISARLTSSPACLVADEHDMSANLARMLKAAGQPGPAWKPILEINPGHPVVARISSDERRFDDWVSVLFDQALLAEGGTLDDPASFVRRVNELMLDPGGEKQA